MTSSILGEAAEVEFQNQKERSKIHRGGIPVLSTCRIQIPRAALWGRLLSWWETPTMCFNGHSTPLLKAKGESPWNEPLETGRCEGEQTPSILMLADSKRKKLKKKPGFSEWQYFRQVECGSWVQFFFPSWLSSLTGWSHRQLGDFSWGWGCERKMCCDGQSSWRQGHPPGAYLTVFKTGKQSWHLQLPSVY